MRRGSTVARLAGGVLAIALAAAAAATTPSTNVFIAGDSTAAEYAPDRYPQLGWGMVLKCAFGDDVAVHNLAQSGRSSKSFITEGFFSRIEHEIQKGDTLLIQFGHNDEKIADAARYTNPETDFKVWLRRYIDTARDRGAQPVLITPVARRKFKDGVPVDTHAPYAQAMRELAAETHTPLIDLTADSMSWLARLGEPASRQYYLVFTPEQHIARFPEGHEDNTHFSEMGARQIAELIIERLSQLKLPISARIKAERPGLTRATPLGGPACT
ncbi:MAG TPA: rhamnogalacturonan acetylesterase [Steroidobacteraceae bacterium]|nr:rhamnogalacturonan acetylesterase [Steroidobacteraceae bacterium]